MILNAMREVRVFYEFEDKEACPIYGPGDVVSCAILDELYRFKVMEVNHKSREYKLTSESLIKKTTIFVGWDELD